MKHKLQALDQCIHSSWDSQNMNFPLRPKPGNTTHSDKGPSPTPWAPDLCLPSTSSPLA